jgi:ABC-type Fe3+/spermidine/putrescine transport system ATPase subunit
MQPDSPPALQCAGLSVNYDGQAALTDIVLEIHRGELVAVLGPSGAGKSTLLAAIAGLVRPSRGEIWLGGRRVADARSSVPPEQRNVAMVFQNYALWPHLTALDTAAYPLRRAGIRRPAARHRARELLAQLGVARLALRRPAELSGGEQQRVGLARALARQATLYLLDEPTAHLDAPLRAAFQAELRARRLTAGAAALVATHDPVEALAVADRVAVLVDGRIEQVGTPLEVYERPATVTAARLTGPVSVLRGRVAGLADGGLSVDFGDGAVTVAAAGGVASVRDGDADLLVRPEWTLPGGPLRGTVVAALFRGGYTDVVVQTCAGEVLLREPGGSPRREGDQIRWRLHRAWAVPPASPGPGDQPKTATAP